MAFTDLNISKQILDALAEAGFEEPTPIQREAFPVIRSGKDMIGIARTGTGKTLAYLIPILMKLHYAQGKYPRAIVVVPTRELVVQVCESVELLTEYMDIRCVGIYGGTNIRTQQNAVYEGVDLLVATPGRFMDIYMNGMLRTPLVKTVVVDEADRLMDLGFMPQLRSILEVIPEKHQTLLFSATFSTAVTALASEFMVAPVKVEVAPQATPVDTVLQLRYDVPNIMTKINLLKLLLADKEEYSRVMVFTESKKNADRITDKLADYWKDELSVIHSNKTQNTRLNALRAFREGRSRIMIASDVAARGIDIQDVSHVVNFDIPALPEEYVHRIGRTARAGKEGVAISLVSPKEEERIEMIEQLIGQKIELQALPERLEISDVLLDEEKIQTANIIYQKGRPKGGGAFHARSAKNSKSPEKKKKSSF
ncbi:DEAD/DEAH box helicase [Odoribacter laneus]|jgi:ATP-dependent RNA helicase|uniref:DEAD/DEAH box helicase n=1 Tax=Odoribacter laneus TaxID=626933 RepID=UPI0018983FC1|nr:DEAD/DEAH box helicase [Odoribacter laneus]GKI22829.1 DEAD/DEAH box helicase [Odoribacter laneus]GKI25272.1 DEAD/DEAH box helicase [Odoribacter laneus]